MLVVGGSDSVESEVWLVGSGQVGLDTKYGPVGISVFGHYYSLSLHELSYQPVCKE